MGNSMLSNQVFARIGCLAMAAAVMLSAVHSAVAQDGDGADPAAAAGVVPAPAGPAAPAAETSTIPGFLLLLGVIALFVVPMFVGNWLAKRLRMPDHGWKFALSIGTIGAAAVLVATGEVKLGPDLSGGTTLIYELADADQVAEEGEDPDALTAGGKPKIEINALIKALVERVDPSGIKEVTIRKYGEGQIEIIIPRAEKHELEQIERSITTAGKLEFRIVAADRFAKHRPTIKIADALPPGETAVRVNDSVVARWVPFEQRNFPGGSGLHTRQVGSDMQALVMTDDGVDVTGEYLTRTSPDRDQANQPAVRFVFNSQGAFKFKQLTGNHLPNPSGGKYNLGILLDGRLLSAPSINERIGGVGQISGLDDDEEVEFLVGILNAGSLPAALNKEPISREETSPTLGALTIQQGTRAIAISLAAVLVFMLFYYRFAGFVACTALAANLILIVGAMILFSGAFTLPGLAGLVLTVGMSVDANVLIFERIREELNRGAALRMAIRNGFARATQTIVDANVTTLITAIVIYKIAPDNVKGFGLTLILGILMSMYTAIFLSRLIFDTADKMKWLKQLNMARIIGETGINFLGKRGIAWIVSFVVIAVGLFGVFNRGRDLLNIDFTGGTSVTMLLKQDHAMEFSEVKKLLDETDLQDKNLSLVEIDGSKTRYRITSVEQDIKVVQQILQEKFGDNMVTYQIEFDGLKPVGGQPQAAGSTELDESNKVSRSADAMRTMTIGLQTDAATDADEAAAPAEPAADDDDATEQAGDDQSAGAADDESQQSSDAGAQAAAGKVETTPPVIANRFAGGVSARLTFGTSGAATSEGVSRDTVQEQLELALQAVEHEGVAIDVSNPDYQGGNRRFTEWDVKIALPEAEARKALEHLKTANNSQPVFPLANKIGGRVAGRMSTDAVAAIVISLIGIIGYIWFRFQRVMYGLAAVIALIHDVAVTLGVIALTGVLVSAVPPLANALMIEKFQISLPIVAAFLTIIGYSLNDTIVVFDRIREVKGKSPNLTADMINRSINETLSRTLLTSLTTLITVLILYVIGGDGIHGFAFALVIGVIVGTYSSIFVASPALLWMSQRAERSAAA